MKFVIVFCVISLKFGGKIQQKNGGVLTSRTSVFRMYGPRPGKYALCAFSKYSLAIDFFSGDYWICFRLLIRFFPVVF